MGGVKPCVPPVTYLPVKRTLEDNVHGVWFQNSPWYRHIGAIKDSPGFTQTESDTNVQWKSKRRISHLLKLVDCWPKREEDMSYLTMIRKMMKNPTPKALATLQEMVKNADSRCVNPLLRTTRDHTSQVVGNEHLLTCNPLEICPEPDQVKTAITAFNAYQ